MLKLMKSKEGCTHDGPAVSRLGMIDVVAIVLEGVVVRDSTAYDARWVRHGLLDFFARLFPQRLEIVLLTHQDVDVAQSLLVTLAHWSHIPEWVLDLPIISLRNPVTLSDLGADGRVALVDVLNPVDATSLWAWVPAPPMLPMPAGVYSELGGVSSQVESAYQYGLHPDTNGDLGAVRRQMIATAARTWIRGPSLRWLTTPNEQLDGGEPMTYVRASDEALLEALRVLQRIEPSGP